MLAEYQVEVCKYLCWYILKLWYRKTAY
jgi:hypothetical protein